MGQSQKAFTALLFPLLSPHISLLSFVKVLGKTRQRRKMEKKGNTRGEQFFEIFLRILQSKKKAKGRFVKYFRTVQSKKQDIQTFSKLLRSVVCGEKGECRFFLVKHHFMEYKH